MSLFSLFRDEQGRTTPVLHGVAVIALGGSIAILPLPMMLGVWLGLGVSTLGMVMIVRGVIRRRAERYDLSRLYDSVDAPEAADPLHDTLDDDAAPYCGWCDTESPPGEPRCVRCGRSF